MRINVYAEELTDRVEHIAKTVDGRTYHGIRVYLYMPVSIAGENLNGIVKGPFIHRENDDDISAITFWGSLGELKLLTQTICKAASDDERQSELLE